MPFVAADPYERLGDVIDTGHCLRHVQEVAGVPHSSLLRRGERLAVMAAPARGVAIGTFDASGRYANATDGSSHAALLVAKRAEGLLVVHPFVGTPVHEWLIRWRDGAGDACNDADAFHVIEAEDG